MLRICFLTSLLIGSSMGLRLIGSPEHLGRDERGTLDLSDSPIDFITDPEAYMKHQEQMHRNSISMHSKSVNIDIWYGRTGNNIIQLSNALIAAENGGKSQIKFPHEKKGHDHYKNLMAIFDLPMSMVLSVEPVNVTRSCKCGHQHCLQAKGPCFTVADRKRVLLKYLSPLLKMKEDPNRGSTDELIIHLRSGDQIKHGFTLQPPCAVYDSIINGKLSSPGYNAVRIITEPDQNHPCIKDLQTRHGADKVKVQSKSISEDVAAIMYTKNLVPAWSTFSAILPLFNANLARVFILMEHMHPMDLGRFPCGEGTTTQQITLNCPGLEAGAQGERKRQSPTANIEWIKNYDATKLSVHDVC